MIDSNAEDINKWLSDIGQHYKKLISVYLGMTKIEIIEQGKDYMTIKTNEIQAKIVWKKKPQ